MVAFGSAESVVGGMSSESERLDALKMVGLEAEDGPVGSWAFPKLLGSCQYKYLWPY